MGREYGRASAAARKPRGRPGDGELRGQGRGVAGASGGFAFGPAGGGGGGQAAGGEARMGGEIGFGAPGSGPTADDGDDNARLDALLGALLSRAGQGDLAGRVAQLLAEGPGPGGSEAGLAGFRGPDEGNLQGASGPVSEPGRARWSGGWQARGAVQEREGKVGEQQEEKGVRWWVRHSVEPPREE